MSRSPTPKSGEGNAQIGTVSESAGNRAYVIARQEEPLRVAIAPPMSSIRYNAYRQDMSPSARKRLRAGPSSC